MDVNPPNRTFMQRWSRLIKKKPFWTLGFPFITACLFGTAVLTQIQQVKLISPRQTMLLREEDVKKEMSFDLDRELKVRHTLIPLHELMN